MRHHYCCVLVRVCTCCRPAAREKHLREENMAGLGDMTPSYPGVAELTRQLDQEKIAMLSKRVDDLRDQNQGLKVMRQNI